MIFLQPNWILAFVCAFTFFGAGKAEAKGGGPDHGLLWGALSVAASAALIKFCPVPRSEWKSPPV